MLRRRLFAVALLAACAAVPWSLRRISSGGAATAQRQSASASAADGQPARHGRPPESTYFGILHVVGQPHGIVPHGQGYMRPAAP